MATALSTKPKKTRKKITYIPAPLPAEGVVREPSVLAVLGISKNAFRNGIKSSIYPAGKLLSPRCRVWGLRRNGTKKRGLRVSIISAC